MNQRSPSENYRPMDWYLVHTKPHQEEVAALSLERLGVEAFFPRLRQSKMIRRKRRTLSGPLFPGYMFSRFDMVTQYRTVNYAHGVQQLVRFGSVPALVEEEIIQSIKARTHNGYVTRCPALFAVGQMVRIEEGPLIGLEAVFEKDLTEQQRVALLLRTVSYQARVIIDREHVGNV